MFKTYLIVDGYNVIHHWAEGEKIEQIRLEEAREDLIHALNSYSGYMDYETILVFDAYSQEDQELREERRGRIRVVFTEKNKTADSYIEKLVYSLPKPYTVKVVTSDYTLQRMVLAGGGERISSREFLEDIQYSKKRMARHAKTRGEITDSNKLEDYMSDTVLRKMKKMRKGSMED
ncbi:MAG: NYN domain-containing protein [Eubacterium sp.]|nr:NYN domain-containing protein [Eubacterium sp.]